MEGTDGGAARAGYARDRTDVRGGDSSADRCRRFYIATAVGLAQRDGVYARRSAIRGDPLLAGIGRECDLVYAVARAGDDRSGPVRAGGRDDRGPVFSAQRGYG